MTNDHDAVLTSIDGRVGRIRLNSPKTLNALNLDAIRAIRQALCEWRSDPRVSLVLIDHVGDRGFCAGGDAAGLATSARSGGAWARRYFAEQYVMNSILFHYPKPAVTFADGATLGGGLGLALPARFTVATDRTLMAFLETTIGLVPDVGASWVLPRLRGATGTWLAFTGTRLKGAETVLHGLADYHVSVDALESLKSELVASPDDVESILAAASTKNPHGNFTEQADVDRLFGLPSAAAIVQALASENTPWTIKQLEYVFRSSPKARAVTFELLRKGKAAATFDDALAAEHQANSALLMEHDFIDWSRANLLEKGGEPARWSPESSEQVTAAQIAAVFRPQPEWIEIPHCCS